MLSLVFPPDNVSTAHLMGCLAADLHRAGHDVSVITTTPHYNRDQEAEAQQPLEKLLPMFRRSTFHGIPVLHVAMPRKTGSIVRRLAAWCLFHVLSTVAALCMPRPDVILCPSPPLTIGISAWVIALLRRSRFIYNVQEMYPDIAIDLGTLRSGLLIKVARLLEHFVYRTASAVTVIAPGMRSRLIERRVSPEKVHLIGNFVETVALKPSMRDESFIDAHSLHGKFIVNYSGNIGPAQGFATLVRVAEELRENTAVHFVIVGAGSFFAALRDDVRRLALSNLTIVDHQPFSRMPMIYAAADICLILQAASTAADGLPSKIYRIMACARPVIALTDPGSDLANLIEDSQCGICISPGDATSLARLLTEATGRRAQWEAMGMSGHEYVAQHVSREQTSSKYGDLIQSLCALNAARAHSNNEAREPQHPGVSHPQSAWTSSPHEEGPARNSDGTCRQ